MAQNAGEKRHLRVVVTCRRRRPRPGPVLVAVDPESPHREEKETDRRLASSHVELQKKFKYFCLGGQKVEIKSG